MSWVSDASPDISSVKTDLLPLPLGADPTKWIQAAADWNKLRAAAIELRNWLRATSANWYGLGANGSDPAPAGITNYLYATATDLFVHVGGTTRRITGGTGDFINFGDYSPIADWNGTTGTDQFSKLQTAVTDAVTAGIPLYIPSPASKLPYYVECPDGFGITLTNQKLKIFSDHDASQGVLFKIGPNDALTNRGTAQHRTMFYVFGTSEMTVEGVPFECADIVGNVGATPPTLSTTVNQTYQLGDYVIGGTGIVGNPVFLCVVAGTTNHLIAPTGTTLNTTVVDGTVTWRRMGAYEGQGTPGFVYPLLFLASGGMATVHLIRSSCYKGSGYLSADGQGSMIEAIESELKGGNVCIGSAFNILAPNLSGTGGTFTRNTQADRGNIADDLITLTVSSPKFVKRIEGRTLVITGATTPANNGSFPIVTWISETKIQYINPVAVNEAFPGTWAAWVPPRLHMTKVELSSDFSHCAYIDGGTSVRLVDVKFIRAGQRAPGNFGLHNFGGSSAPPNEYYDCTNLYFGPMVQAKILTTRKDAMEINGVTFDFGDTGTGVGILMQGNNGGSARINNAVFKGKGQYGIVTTVAETLTRLWLDQADWSQWAGTQQNLNMQNTEVGSVWVISNQILQTQPGGGTDSYLVLKSNGPGAASRIEFHNVEFKGTNQFGHAGDCIGGGAYYYNCIWNHDKHMWHHGEVGTGNIDVRLFECRIINSVNTFGWAVDQTLDNGAFTDISGSGNHWGGSGGLYSQETSAGHVRGRLEPRDDCDPTVRTFAAGDLVIYPSWNRVHIDIGDSAPITGIGVFASNSPATNKNQIAGGTFYLIADAAGSLATGGNISRAVKYTAGEIIMIQWDVTSRLWTPSKLNSFMVIDGTTTAITTTLAVGNQYLGCTGLAGNIVVNIPLANSVPNGYLITIKDEDSNASVHTITITRAGGDTIDGATTFVMNINGESTTLRSNGSTKWFIV